MRRWVPSNKQKIAVLCSTKLVMSLRNKGFRLVRRLHLHEPFFDVPAEGAGSPSVGDRSFTGSNRKVRGFSPHFFFCSGRPSNDCRGRLHSAGKQVDQVVQWLGKGA